MKTRLVTAYVPIPNHPRTAAEYGELGEKLSGVPVRKKCFYQRVEDLWMSKYIRQQNGHVIKPPIRASEGDNPLKNTVAYHSVNHQKTSWLVQAADEYPDDDVFVWVDYGVFHLPGVTNKAIYEFMEKVDDRAIYAPGCWDKPIAVESVGPCWRFCGTVLAVPRKLVDKLDFECRDAARQHIAATRNVEWEVNTWARVEQKTRLPFHWYKADHNETLFTGLELKP
jgi:hypothetical protein